TAAELTYAGLVAHPDRASLLAGLTGRPEPARAKLMPALHRAEQRLTTLLQSQVPERVRRSELAATTRAGLDCELGEVLSNRRITRLGVALRDTAIRDEVWLAVDSRTVSLGQLLHQLHSALPAPYDAAPMFLYGWDRWRSGSGTLACEAADRALRSDPGYSAARLLIEAVQSGLDPHSTPCLRKPGG
ncbi:MAG TPA: DUF4192 domain-containing protein, partial [Jatrophihabitans sp.]|nr:DUF4192 domain-containing protein [Jatrophihabitans sp.]